MARDIHAMNTAELEAYAEARIAKYQRQDAARRRRAELYGRLARRTQPIARPVSRVGAVIEVATRWIADRHRDLAHATLGSRSTWVRWTSWGVAGSLLVAEVTFFVRLATQTH